jgi:hypothetical protein
MTNKGYLCPPDRPVWGAGPSKFRSGPRQAAEYGATTTSTRWNSFRST